MPHPLRAFRKGWETQESGSNFTFSHPSQKKREGWGTGRPSLGLGYALSSTEICLSDVDLFASLKPAWVKTTKVQGRDAEKALPQRMLISEQKSRLSFPVTCRV